MSLKSRLSHLQAQAGAKVLSPAAKPEVSELRARIEQLEKGRRSTGASARLSGPRTFSGIGPPCSARTGLIPGESIGDGLIRIRRRVPLRGKLGSIDLLTLRQRPQLPGEPDERNLRRVYIDTETTGLSGGSGTLAFLIGVAVVKDDALDLTQFLMTRFAAEAASLAAFAATLTPDDQLVSYNGRSYDQPLLLSRYRIQGLPHPFGGLLHLDLLQPVRRLFSKRWSDCRLQTLEQNLLGFDRVDDLPGSAAPDAWFNFIRSGQEAALIKALEHNQQDIVSLAVAHSALTQAVCQPREFGVDLYALARWLLERNEGSARNLLRTHADALCDDGKRLLARLERRAGHWSQAIALWESLAAAGCTDSLERLAKYHEHISKDLVAARHCCARLPGSEAQQRRRQRIEAKISRQL